MQPVRQNHRNTPPDIAIIAAAVSLIRRHAGERRPMPQLTAAARACLVAHPWAADLHGLEECIERALVLCDADTIDPCHLALTLAEAPAGAAREADAILASLQAANGQRREAAATLGIAPRTLRMKLAELRTRGFSVPSAQTCAQSGFSADTAMHRTAP